MGKLDLLLEEYYTSRDSKQYHEAFKVLKSIIRIDQSAWSYTTMSEEYFRMGRYKLSLRYAHKAYAINPHSPLVKWNLAGSYLLLKEHAKAKELYEEILLMGEIEIGKIQTRYGLTWARSLITDCSFRVSECYFFLYEYDKALLSLNEFAKKREKHKSLYSKKDAFKLRRVIAEEITESKIK